MAKFTDAENTLLDRIEDHHLGTSLAQIRQAVENIWAPDTPRVIQDYTDHGIEHVERLARWAVELLKASDGRPLTTAETYLLLAGIYLHDIGMQCDVLKLPEIKTRAESLGATFEIEFTARRANDYSVEEQKAIRKNHHYLSIAWIDHANRTGDTLLGTAAKTIPEDLVDDLMDVCVHHTTRPIFGCPVTLKFDPTGRKQLVAALLRFADELDIDSRRVSNVETIRSFSLNPANEVYWWLHNRTKIVFGARNVVILTIRLHPNDMKEYGSFVNTAFLTAFQTKNQPVLTILGSNGIPIVISSESNVVPHDRAKRLPPEIAQALRALQKKADPLTAVADEIRTWLQALRYELTTRPQTNPRVLDMIAALEQGALKQRVLVRCIDGEISRADVDEMAADLGRKTPQAWLISDKRVSPAARELAAKDEDIEVFTLSEFLSQKVWKPYFDALQALAEKDRIPSLYVDIGCYRQLTDQKGGELDRERHSSLNSYIDLWLKERGKMHISLLGEFGGGKTWFCRHYAYVQLQRYLNDPVRERLPLLITLRAFAKAMTPQQLINDALLEQYKLPFLGSAFQVFEEMNRRGKLLLLLDGFDEMARQVDYQTVIDNFWQLAELVDESSKVILTSRTEYFRWARESQKILGGEEYGRRTIVLQPPKFEVLHLDAFTDPQIRDVIVRRVGQERGPELADKILKTPNLAEMARKPILVELLLAALEEVSADVLDNPAQVYLFATNRLLLRNIDTQRTFTTTADKLFFLCELAWEMIKTGELRIHYAAIPERIKSYFGDRIKDQHELDTWDFDLRNQTLLRRDAAGYYEFAHKSLAEYFVALKFAAELGCLNPVFPQTYTEANGRPCELPLRWRSLEQLAATFGALAFTDERMHAIRDLLFAMLVPDAPTSLWTLLKATKNKSFDAVRYVGGNAATLLSLLREPFASADLAGAVLAGANLVNTDLTGINLNGASLRAAHVGACVLRNADLRRSDWSQAAVWEALRVSSLAWSPDGQQLACLGDRLAVWIWRPDRATPRVLREHGSMHKIRWSPRGDRLAAATDDGALVWDAASLQLSATVQIERNVAVGLDFSPDGRHLMAGGYKTAVFEVDSGRLHHSAEPELVYDVQYSPTGDIAAVGCEGGLAALVDASTGATLLQWSPREESFITSVAFLAPDHVVTLGTRVSVWKDGALVAELAGGRASAIAAFPSRKLLAVGRGNGDFEIWSGIPPELQLSFHAHGSAVVSLSFSRDGKYLASGGNDSTARIWPVGKLNAKPMQPIKALEMSMDCTGAQVSGVTLEGSLLEFFAGRGAILDDKQKAQLARSPKKRAPKKKR
ncbi:MAG TPA: pentapeptide repeat-containing protein [Bryobacteraceae bacterium]|nr:pentapeptide repeat-containing protein [Bryobacteraceae bacterium]